MAERREVYMNPIQQRIYYAGAKHIRAICSRRFGKTDGIIGPQSGRVTSSMPQGAGIWAGNSRKQLFTRTVPATLAAIERFWGWREGQHFWWGQPPSKLNIPRPIIKPKDWSHCITFFNGFVWHLVSLEVRGSANSMTVNYFILDEARFIKKEKFDAEVQATLSGIIHPMGDPRFSDQNPYYKGTLFVSDAAISQKENWMEREEEQNKAVIETGEFAGKTSKELQDKLDEYANKVMFFNELFRTAKKTGHSVITVSEEKREEIRLVASCCYERKGVFKMLPKPGVNKQNIDMLVNYKVISSNDAELLFNHEYLITKDEYLEFRMIERSDKFKKYIKKLQCNTFAFYRASTLDNIDLLGADYIADMKRSLPPVIFAISILNMKKKHSSDGFYSLLDIENTHGYVPSDCPAIEMSMQKKKASTDIGGRMIETDFVTPNFAELQNMNKNCTMDGDVQSNLPLHIAFDYNANINWVVTGQVYHCPEARGDALYTLSSMYAKNERKLGELCKDWCRYYAPHKNTCRQVNYYYDSTAKFRGYAIEGQQDFKDLVTDVLTQNGWEVNAIDMGRPAEHSLKFKDINEALAGVSYPAVRFNVDNNEALIVAMENTEVQNGYNGFKKNKALEKLAETEDSPLQFRTDGTDAWDVLFMGVKYFQHNLEGFCLPRRG